MSFALPGDTKLPAFLSPRDGTVEERNPRRPELCAKLEAIRTQEDAVRYRQALLSALDTELPTTPTTGACAAAKRRAQAVLRAGRPQRTQLDGFDGVAPSAFQSYRSGARLAKVGMDYEAAANFCEGLWNHPDSDLLRSAFDHTVTRAKCSCRSSWARPCPPPRRWKGRDGHDERVRGVTWSCCEQCGTIWPDQPRLMIRLRRRKDGGEELEEVDEDDSGHGGPQRSREAIHAHYANQSGNTEEQLLGASAFTMDRRELNMFLSDCGIFPDNDNKYLNYNEISLMFTRVNWSAADAAKGSPKASPPAVRTGFGSSGEDGDPAARDAFNAKVNNYDDSEAELTVAEFAHLVLRVSQARLPPKRRGRDVAQQLVSLLEERVIPHAKRDALEFLRDALTADRQLRHVTHMYRHKLGALFRKHCGPVRGDRTDKTSRDHMSLRSFTELIKRSGLQEMLGVPLKELTLTFAQSQSESYSSFEGAVDTEMSYHELLEALLRLGVKHRAGPDGISGVQLPDAWLRDALVPVLEKLCGDLEGGRTKLSWKKLQRLISEENERLAEIKVGMMMEDFSVVPAGRPDLPPPPDEQVQWEMGAEAVFRRMLEALEREGDIEAGRQPPPAQLTFKPNAVARHSKLRNLGMAVRLGLRMGDAKAAGGLGSALTALKAMQDAPKPKITLTDLIKKEKSAPPPLMDVDVLAGL